jgi:AAA domain, putative AbiEii toxin, Type IV TA system/AAA ATPase domain
MLTRLHVQGYKALRDIDTTLEPLTVIVGPNGCGKTSVLESIMMVRDLVVQRDEARALHPFEELHTKNGTSSPNIEVDLWMELDEVNRALLKGYEPGRDDELKLAVSHGKELDIAFTVESRAQPSGAAPVFQGTPERLIRVQLGSTRLLAFDTKALARPSYLRAVVPKMDDDGGGLATVLSTLIGEQREKFEEIQSELREFVPEVERILIRPAPISVVEAQDVPVGLDKEGKEILASRHYQRNVIGNEVFFDYRHAKGVRARHASEGTLLLLGLLTVVHTDDISVLLLDDIDRALHPKAQQQLVESLRKLSERGVQTIATTHSPYLVLHLEYDEVRAMTLSDAGGALMGKLTEHPEYGRWSEHMSTSEFWTVFGEQWLTKRAKDHG